jgi:hypothetical protein
LLPFEFIVQGIPRSAQGKNKPAIAAWRAKVRAAAELAWPGGEPAVAHPVEFQATYFYDQHMVDVDNIIKPMQDALVGIAYVDDVQVQRTSCRRRDLNGAYTIKGASAAILSGFAAGTDFVHILVLEYHEPGDLKT